MPTTNAVLRDSLYLVDNAAAAITGADLSDFTATATLLGTATTAAVTIAEESGGWYGTAFTPTAVGRWRLVVAFDDGTTERTFTETYDVDDGTVIAETVASRLRRSVVTIEAPVVASSVVKLQQGDDYLNADGRALEWTGTNWPDLTGADVEWQVRLRDDVTIYPVTVVDAETVRVELTAEQTDALTPLVTRTYQIVATLDNESIVTLAEGSMFVDRL